MKVSVDTVRGTATVTIPLNPEKMLQVISDALSEAQREVDDRHYPGTKRAKGITSNV